MRSTQKDIARLYREVRQVIGVRTNREAGEHISKASRYYTSKLNRAGIVCVMVTPYKDNTWGIYGLRDNKQTFLALTTEALLDTPTDNVKRFIEFANC